MGGETRAPRPPKPKKARKNPLYAYLAKAEAERWVPCVLVLGGH